MDKKVLSDDDGMEVDKYTKRNPNTVFEGIKYTSVYYTALSFSNAYSRKLLAH